MMNSERTETNLVDAKDLIQRQLDAYNAHDLEGLLSIYSPNAELFEHPSKLVANGTAALRERFTARLQEPNLHAELLNRIVMDNMVIDSERVTRTFPEGPGTIELIMIYQVENGKIAKAWSIAGEKKLFL